MRHPLPSLPALIAVAGTAFAAASVPLFERFEREIIDSVEHPSPTAAMPKVESARLAAPGVSAQLPHDMRLPPEYVSAPPCALPPPPSSLGAAKAPPPPTAAPWRTRPGGARAPRAPSSPAKRAEAALGTRVPLALPACPSDVILGRLLFEGVRDGEVNPRLPSSRAPLGALLLRPGSLDRDDVFDALLAAFPGPGVPARVRAARSWADGSGDDALAREVALRSIRALRREGENGLAAEMASEAERRFPEIAGQARVARALALAGAGDTRGAASALAAAEDDPAFREYRAEIRFALAWVAIEEDRRADAAILLRRILRDHPGSPFAPKARRALSLLDEDPGDDGLPERKAP